MSDCSSDDLPANVEAFLARRRVRTSKARETFLASFANQVDPDGQLDAGERHRLATEAYVEHMRTLAVRSAQARRQRRLDRIRDQARKEDEARGEPGDDGSAA